MVQKSGDHQKREKIKKLLEKEEDNNNTTY